MLLAATGRLCEARPILERSCEREQWKQFTLWYLGHCYYDAGEYSKAKATLSKAIEFGLPPKWESGAHDILGRTDYYLGNMDSAKRHFESYRRSADPEHLTESRTFEWLEKTCGALGLRDEAERYHRLSAKNNRHKPN